MTKRERAQVVELLRCAADVCVMSDEDFEWPDTPDWWAAIAIASGYDDGPDRWAAMRAEDSLSSTQQYREQRLHDLLEAAQRVEDGEWP